MNVEKCSACSGSGYYDSDGSPACDACNGTGKRFVVASMFITKDIRDIQEVLTNIRKIFAKYDLFISAKMCMAIAVEYVITVHNIQAIRDILATHIDQRQQDIYDATLDVVDYLETIELSASGALFMRDDNSWVQFTIDGKNWYIDFKMHGMLRSDIYDGPYSVREG